MNSGSANKDLGQKGKKFKPKKPTNKQSGRSTVTTQTKIKGMRKENGDTQEGNRK